MISVEGVECLGTLLPTFVIPSPTGNRYARSTLAFQASRTREFPSASRHRGPVTVGEQTRRTITHRSNVEGNGQRDPNVSRCHRTIKNTVIIFSSVLYDCHFPTTSDIEIDKKNYQIHTIIILDYRSRIGSCTKRPETGKSAAARGHPKTEPEISARCHHRHRHRHRRRVS